MSMMSKLCAGMASIMLLLSVGAVRGEDRNAANTYAWARPPSQGPGVWQEESHADWKYYDVLGEWVQASHAPQSNDTVYIGNYGTVDVSESAQCYFLHIGCIYNPNNYGDKGSGTLNVSNDLDLTLNPGDPDGCAYIGEIGTASVLQTGGSFRAHSIWLGTGSCGGASIAGGHATYDLTGGNLWIDYPYGGTLQAGLNGTCQFTQSGGEVALGNGMFIGGSNGWATYELRADGVLVAGEYVHLNGSLVQTGGTLSVGPAESNADYNAGFGVASERYAQYVQRQAGTCTVTLNGLQIGAVARYWLGPRDYYTAWNPGADEWRGYYCLSGDAILTADGFQGTFPLEAIGVGSGTTGSGGATGFMYLAGGCLSTAQANGVALRVRRFSDSTGILRGWSNDTTQSLHVNNSSALRGVHMDGPLENNGRIIADGGGLDSRILDLSGFHLEADDIHGGSYRYPVPAVINTIDNKVDSQYPRVGPPDNGWFAQNHGELVLPLLHTSDKFSEAPDHPESWPPVRKAFCRWGEGTYNSVGTPIDQEIDLINSLYFETSVDSPLSTGVLGTLLAPDRGEFAIVSPLATGWIPLGIWNLKAEDAQGLPSTVGLTTLKARYDDTQLTPAAEAKMGLIFRDQADSGWTEDATQIDDRDAGAHTITANIALGQSMTFSDRFFAVAMPGWVWKGGDGAWAGSINVWEGNLHVPAAFPSDPAYAACIDKGGTVTIGSGTSASASMLLLGCNDDVATGMNSLQINGGTLAVQSLRIGAVSQLSKGEIDLNGGDSDTPLTVGGDIFVGENGSGTVVQNGGTCRVGRMMHIGMYPTAVGTYSLLGGTLAPTPTGHLRICVGTEGTGVLELRGGTVSDVEDLTIRSNMYAKGTLQGYGVVFADPAITAPHGAHLTMNGKVIADGYGQEKTLDLSMFKTGLRLVNDNGEYESDTSPALPAIRNNIDNIPAYGSTDNGWFARHGGELLLPTIDIGGVRRLHDTRTFVWGDAAWTGSLNSYIDQGEADKNHASEGGYGYTIDLINSVQLTFGVDCELSTVSGPETETVDIALLAPDRREIQTTRTPPANALPLGLWRMRFNQFANDGSSRLLTLKFRYDNTGLSVEDEKQLKVMHWNGSDWVLPSNTQEPPDVVDHIIWARVPSFSDGGDEYFGVFMDSSASSGERWEWCRATAGWTEAVLNGLPGAFWDRIGFIGGGHPFPDSLYYSAYVYNGKTATISNADAESYMAADTLYLGQTYDGSADTGFVSMSDGTLSLNYLRIAEVATSTGTFTLTGGTLDVPDITVGQGGIGQLALGDGNGTGRLTGVHSLAVACHHGSSCPGDVKGWGKIDVVNGATFTNNGSVIASGNGDPDHVLDLSGFATIGNTIANPTTGTNGWYAEQKGKLSLPLIPVVAGNAGPYNWGEKGYSALNPDVDLVNSLQITPTAGLSTGDLSISLLATDREEPAIAALTSVGYGPIAVWEVKGPVPFTYANVRARYDHTNSLITQGFAPSCCDTPQEPFLALAQGVNSEGTWRWTIVGRAGSNALHQIASVNSVDFSGGTTYLAIVQPYPGDTNLDGDVNTIDKLIVDDAWGKSLGDTGFDPAADIDGNGTVNVVDLLYMGSVFGSNMLDEESCPLLQEEQLQMMQAGLASACMSAVPTPEPQIQAAAVTGALQQGIVGTVDLCCEVFDPSGTIQSVTADLASLGGQVAMLTKGTDGSWAASGAAVQPSRIGRVLVHFAASDANGPRASGNAYLSVGPFQQAMLAGNWMSEDGCEVLTIDDSGNVLGLWEAPEVSDLEILCDGQPHLDLLGDQVTISPHQFVLGSDGGVTMTPFTYTVAWQDEGTHTRAETISGQGWLSDATHIAIVVTYGQGQEGACSIPAIYTKITPAP